MEMKVSMNNPESLGEHTKIDSLVPLAALTDEDFQKLIRSIMVVIPHRASEGIHAGLAMHFGIWGRIGLMYSVMKDHHGGFMEITRGGIERAFIDSSEKNPELEYLVMIDNDQAITWDAPLLLANHRKSIVSGVVAGYNSERGIFACFTSSDKNGVPRFPSYRFTKNFPGKGLKKVHQVGTGLVCIHRSVFETLVENGEFAFMIDDTLRKEGYRTGLVKQGEDFTFCDKARKAGFEIYVDFSVRAIHYKTIGLAFPEELVDDDLDANDWTVSDLDFRGLKHAV